MRRAARTSRSERRARADADEDALAASATVARDAVLAAIGLHVGVDALGGAPQRELAQGEQVAALEEVLDRARACSGT